MTSPSMNRSQKRPRVAHLEEKFEGYLAIDITTMKIKEFIDERKAMPSKNATINQDLRAFAHFGYLTAWRFEEVAGLIWNRVNMSRKTIELRPEKRRIKRIDL